MLTPEEVHELAADQGWDPALVEALLADDED